MRFKIDKYFRPIALPEIVLGIIPIIITVLFSCCSPRDESIDDYLESLPKVDDAEGNSYPYIELFGKYWFVTNLKTTLFNDTTTIPHIVIDEQWGSTDNAAFCWYNNNPEMANTYGALYNWHAVNSGKLCPQGWRVPTEEDWQQLIDSLGGEKVAGGKLKIKGTEFWEGNNNGASNSSGFRALPGGYRNLSGEFKHLGEYGFWWSSSVFDDNNAWYRSLYYYSERTYRNYFRKTIGYSVRCVKDK